MLNKLYCIASFKAKDGKQQELLETLRALEPITKKEEGCIQYIVTKHYEHPNAMGKSYPIVFNEIFESKEAFEFHCNQPYIVDFFETHCVQEDGLVEDFNVSVYTDQIN